MLFRSAARARRIREADRERARLERMIREADARIDRLVEAIAAGGEEFTAVRSAMARARDDREAAAAELRAIDDMNVVELHPGLADQYRKQIASLSETLASDHHRREAVPQIRSLIDGIILTPKQEGRGVDITLTGRLATMLDLAAGKPLPAMYGKGGAGSGDRTRITSLEG